MLIFLVTLDIFIYDESPRPFLANCFDTEIELIFSLIFIP